MQIRPARTSDVRTIRTLIDQYAPDRRLLAQGPGNLFEDGTHLFFAWPDGVGGGWGAATGRVWGKILSGCRLFPPPPPACTGST